ncbi:MAG: hypothetical protein P8N02_05155 [Actinomycetota bacterium]|nr:hypothetical protein [Actinomycetota bacterium]
MTPPPTPNDELVLQQRERMARIAQTGQRTGYLLFCLAIVVFVSGLLVGFTTAITTLIVVCLIAGSVVLAPTIVLGYAVKAADREDRGLPHGH